MTYWIHSSRIIAPSERLRNASKCRVNFTRHMLHKPRVESKTREEKGTGWVFFHRPIIKK